MNKIVSIIGAALLLLAGCTNEPPTAAQVSTISTTIGYASAVAVDLTKMNDKTKIAIVEVVNAAKTVIPSEKQTFSEAWAPIIDTNVKAIVASGKLTEAEAQIVCQVAGVFATGVDYMFSVRWPTIRQYSDLISAGITGFYDGFSSVLKPAFAATKIEYDQAEFDKATTWLKANMKK